jgi:hypothetical protein
MRAARETYPLEVAYGITFSKENGRTVAEIVFPSDNYVEHAVTEGIKVGKSTLLGTCPLRPQAKVIRVSVSDIPMLTPDMKQVQQDLKSSMSRFGTVLEATLFNDPMVVGFAAGARYTWMLHALTVNSRLCPTFYG